MQKHTQAIYNTATSNVSLPDTARAGAPGHNLNAPQLPPEAVLNPLVSVVIPAYNAEKFIERTLRSVLNQTYNAIEIVVVDDGSTDATADIAGRYASSHPQIRVYSQVNAGVAAARNLGIEKAKGFFIAPLDADDVWARTNIEKQVNTLLESDRTVGMVYSWSVKIDEADQLTGKVKASPYYGNIYPAMLYANVVGNGSACLIRRSCLETAGGYSRNFFARQAQGCEDWEMYLRIARAYEVALVPEPLVGYRQVGGSMSSQSRAMIKSQKLAFQPIKEQFPKVYRQISRWASCLSCMYASEQALEVGDISLAWQRFRKGLKHDPLITFATYVYCRLIVQLVIRTGMARLRPRHTRHSASRPRTRSSPLSKLGSAIDLGLRMILSPLFPARFIRQIRMRWVSAQVCPHQPGPKTLSKVKINWLVLKVQLQAKQKKQPIDFGL